MSHSTEIVNETSIKVTGKESHLKRWVLTALKLIFALGLIYWMVQRGSLDFKLLSTLTHPAFLFPALLAGFLNIFFNNYRWMILLKGQKFETSVRQTLPLSYIGLFFNFAMPGGVGGDLVKGFYLMQDHSKRRTAAATSVLMDRLIGFVGMVVMSLVAIGLNLDVILAKPELVSLAIAVVGLFFGFVAFFVMAFSKRIYGHAWVETLFAKLPGGATFKKIYEALHSYHNEPRYFWQACGLTVLSQCIALTFFVIIGNALNIADVSIATYAFVIPLGLISTALPISPAGIGVGQAVFLVLFNWSLGYETQLGPSLITAHQMMSFVMGVVGSYFYFRRKKPNLEELEA